MRAKPSIGNPAILCVALATLLGCAEPQSRPQEAGAARNVAAEEPVSAATLAELGRQVASLQRYAAQMEKTYAAQEAEILALKREIAGSASCAPQVSPEARLGFNAATALAARQSVAF
jgi:hypothetical protein